MSNTYYPDFSSERPSHSGVYGQHGDRTKPPPDMYPRDTYPKDTYPLVTYPLYTYPPVTYPLDTYPLDTYPLGHIPPRTYTPKTLEFPIWFMHHVLIAYCTLKNIHFAEIAFSCDVGAIKLIYICSVRKGLIPTTTSALDSQDGGGRCAHVRCQF